MTPFPKVPLLAARPLLRGRGRVGQLSTKHVVRAVLLIWTVSIACPVRYWPIEATVDNTWISALNYAAAHGLAIGRDVVWTTGPSRLPGLPARRRSEPGHTLWCSKALYGRS